MPQCPQCSKPLREFTRRCPSCQADLDLLVDYVSHLEGGLTRAERLTRAGELGQAFWAYLEVLEVDPDNPSARRQIGQVVTAVRQFDRVAPGRRWQSGAGPDDPGWWSYRTWILSALAGVLIIIAFAVGFAVGSYTPAEGTPEPPPVNKPDDNTLRGRG